MNISDSKKSDSKEYRNKSGKPRSFNVNSKLSKSRLLNGTQLQSKGVKPIDRSELREEGDRIDELFGFQRHREGGARLGWLLNYLPITMRDEVGEEKSGLDLYFIDRDGINFKSTIFYEPYFYVGVSHAVRVMELTQHLPKRLEGCRVEIIDKEDLDMPNHLSGKTHRFLKLSFNTVSDLMDAKTVLRPIILENQKKSESNDHYDSVDSIALNGDPLNSLNDMREFDVPYAMRVAIDMDIRVGAWHMVTPEATSASCSVNIQKDMLEMCEPKLLAFDIECEKSPLKFPNAERDRIFMISYMTTGQGYLLINREIVSEDIQDFEYTPSSKYPGPFKVFNLTDEEAVLRKFVDHIQDLKPHVLITYNGDFFDWPYIDARCKKYGISLYKSLGIRCVKGEASPTGSSSQGEYIGRSIVHLDAFSWVQRDSYLPQGNQGLKAVTKYKLGYDPIEVDPEDMVAFARDKPAYMASYSVSDAVSTYYLYTTYVHNFIFSLSTIVPMGPEDVLRKGSGTLCESLLMVEAYHGNIICPNKQVDPVESFTKDGHLLESETYIGGHVECLETGIFRCDIPIKFSLVPSALNHLIDRIDRDLSFACEVEHGMQRHDIVNYDEVRQAIIEKLEMLRDCPQREENPVIYHLDVGAMYPNIILTNRLQPSAMVSHKDCASCDFNQSSNQCKREMTWQWRGDYNPASASDYAAIRRQLTYEKLGDKTFAELNEKEQATLVHDRLKAYAHRVYKKTKVTSTELRVNIVCQRENAFYVNTVRAFRDRRYEYKLLTKQWKGKKTDAEKKGDSLGRKSAEDKEILMDSLQLAHKCILNSFYGYVMRKGARWRSMEMAGIVTHTGAKLITQARELIEQVGRPLELDTDGIWCVLPASFPQDFKFKTKNGKSITIGYPCAMLNADVHDRYTNHQYQDLIDNKPGKYTMHSECSIFFELDGPYKAMILPASPEEGKLLKKKYVVFNFDNTLAELKGFEVKRRGELELVKIFQTQVFENFLSGGTLEECYQAVANIANHWLDVLDEKGITMDDDELLDLISEKKTISKTLDDYEGRKATSLTTAGRLADFLGDEMTKDKGLNCKLIISKYPINAPTTERAIPVAIFSADLSTRQYYLRRWLKEPSMNFDDFRDVVDWDYYKDRLGKTIQKIITIPAGMQKVANPVPRVEHPVWLQKRLSDMNSKVKQQNLLSMFKSTKLVNPSPQRGRKSILKETPNRNNNQRVSYLSPSHAKDVSNRQGLLSKKRLLFDENDTVNHSTGHIDDIIQSPRQESHVDIASTISPTGINEVSSPVSTTVRPEQDLQLWLKDRHRYWKLNRQQKKDAIKRATLRSWGQTDQSILTKKPVLLSDYVKNAAIATTYGYWQILEYQQTDTPGDFIVWAMTGNNQMQKLRISVPRIMYINCSGIEAEKVAKSLNGSKIVRDLPHGRLCRNLYEVQVPEAKYQSNENSLSLFLCDPSVEGVYETQVPLMFRLIVTLGCVAQLTREAQQLFNKNQQRSYKLQDLSFINTTAQSYLDSTNGMMLKQIFIYAISDKSRSSGLGMVAMFIMDSSVTSSNVLLSSRAFVWLSNGGSSFIENKPPFQRLYQRFQPNESSATVKFSSSYVTNMTEAYRSCNEKLITYAREKHGPTIIIAQGSLDLQTWRRQMNALQDFPLTIIPSSSLDELFPAIGWQMFVAERLIQRYLYYPTWFHDRLISARSSHIPICNLGNDSITTIADVTFARALIQARHVLWASENRFPDIGGIDSDNSELLTGNLLSPSSINEPGAYRNICVELDVYGLAICSILNASMLDTQNLSSINNASALGEAHCGKAFAILKAVIVKWFDDTHNRGDQIADSLLTGFYRYLCGYGDALLYDPLLYRLVNDLMTKLFKRLINEFRKIGVQIIYADLNRIIVYTNKFDYNFAKEYIEFILMAIRNTDIFGYLEITPKTYWDELLWLGPDNYGGLVHKDPNDSVTNETTDSKESKDLVNQLMNNNDEEYDEYSFLDKINDPNPLKDDNDELDREPSIHSEDENDDDNKHNESKPSNDNSITNQSTIQCEWSIAKYLPTAARNYFEDMIGVYISYHHMKKLEILESYSDQTNESNMLMSSHRNNHVITSEELNNNINNYMKILIQDNITSKLLQIIDELNNVLYRELTISNGHGGSCSRIALDFIKYTIHIMQLDDCYTDEVAGLKRILLAELKIREFSPLSQFTNPSPTYFLKDVICRFCSTCRDVDLLKDMIMSDDGTINRKHSNYSDVWRCDHCHHRLDVIEMENRLVEEVERLITSYLIQDFRCPRTHRVSVRYCASHSEVAVPLEMDYNLTELKKEMSLLHLVAKTNEFHWLMETIDELHVSND